MRKITVTLLSLCAVIVSAAGSALAGNPPPPPAPVPEPGTFALLGIGAVGVLVYKKFKK